MNSIDGNELVDAMAAGGSHLIVDVRSSWEFKRGHVPGAVHLPFWKAFSPSQSLTEGCNIPGNAPVVVYCEHGPRAVVARFALHRAGCDDIVYLRGHMSGWRKQGLPVEKAEKAEKADSVDE